MSELPAGIRLPTRRELTQEKYPAPEMACRLHDHAHDLLRARKPGPALIALRRALALAPAHPMMLSALGSALFESGRYPEAEQALRQSVAIEPDYAPSRAGLGSTLAAQNRFAEARIEYDRALTLEPDYTDAIWNFSMVLLDHGAWDAAWPFYQERKKRGGPRLYPQMPYREWQGENLNGKTLFVHGEQGVGDRILFARYLHWVKAAWPTCTIKCLMTAADLPDISNLMWAYQDRVCEFIPNAVPWPRDVDYGIFLMDLPARHGSQPDQVYADPGLMRDYARGCRNSVSLPTANGNEFKVGINWTGSPGMIRNNERSVPPELMFTLAETPDVVLYSLQFGSQDVARLGADQLVCDLTSDIGQHGFLGTAAVMQNLDLVITNCTSVAHLAGALEVPCWLMLCANPYWVWGRAGETTPWYPTLRLFRQRAMNDWAPVVADVKTRLFDLAAAHVAAQAKAA